MKSYNAKGNTVICGKEIFQATEKLHYTRTHAPPPPLTSIGEAHFKNQS